MLLSAQCMYMYICMHYTFGVIYMYMLTYLNMCKIFLKDIQKVSNIASKEKKDLGG